MEEESAVLLDLACVVADVFKSIQKVAQEVLLEKPSHNTICILSILAGLSHLLSLPNVKRCLWIIIDDARYCIVSYHIY